MKKSFIEKITGRTFRKAAKTFIIFLIIMSLFVYFFIKLVYYLKENILVVKKPMIKQEPVDVLENGTEDKKIVLVGNITVT
jgi:hypothetical protein